jgi:hypothetical protein
MAITALVCNSNCPSRDKDQLGQSLIHQRHYSKSSHDRAVGATDAYIAVMTVRVCMVCVEQQVKQHHSIHSLFKLSLAYTIRCFVTSLAHSLLKSKAVCLSVLSLPITTNKLTLDIAPAYVDVPPDECKR